MPRQEHKAKGIFLSGMLSRGLTPIENLGDGNCLFISLAHIVMGDPGKFDFIR